jgi:hypothetical protein
MIKPFTVLIMTLLASSMLVCGQSQWESWEQNYREVRYAEVLELEKQYADSIEGNEEIVQTYSRIDKYKLRAIYKGETRKIDNEVLASMKRVFKLFIGNPGQLDEIVKKECLFEIEGQEVWMPIQSVLVKPLKKEVALGDEIILYCMFFNEHGLEGELRNIFFISEFRGY